jgi:hypothetical protein
MLLQDAKLGDVLFFKTEDLNDSYNGYHATKDLTGTVVKSYDGSCLTIAWTATENNGKGIDLSSAIFAPEYPELTFGVRLRDITPCTLVNAKVKVKDTKVGDKIKVPLYNKTFTMDSTHLERGEYLVATVIAPTINGGCLLGWSESNLVHSGHEQPLRTFDHHGCDLSKFSELKFAAHLNDEIPCELIASIKSEPIDEQKSIKDARKPNSALFLMTCIAAGAGLSHYSRKVKDETQNDYVYQRS